MNVLRIIGGKYRSLHLELPPLDKSVRPTQDKVRGAIFSALGTKVENAACLDLFAGSGAYGFEAISRGAKKATFTDKNKKCIEAIKKSATKLKCENQVEIINGDYQTSLNMLKAHSSSFDLIFLDPPYIMNVNKTIIKFLNDNKMLNSKAVIVAEQEEEIPEIEGFGLKTYKYSYKRVGIYRKED